MTPVVEKRTHAKCLSEDEDIGVDDAMRDVEDERVSQYYKDLLICTGYFGDSNDADDNDNVTVWKIFRMWEDGRNRTNVYEVGVGGDPRSWFGSLPARFAARYHAIVDAPYRRKPAPGGAVVDLSENIYGMFCQ
jgi:hypothetical protein